MRSVRTMDSGQTLTSGAVRFAQSRDVTAGYGHYTEEEKHNIELTCPNVALYIPVYR
jgi:hypothetical protein